MAKNKQKNIDDGAWLLEAQALYELSQMKGWSVLKDRFQNAIDGLDTIRGVGSDTDVKSRQLAIKELEDIWNIIQSDVDSLKNTYKDSTNQEAPIYKVHNP